MKFIPLHTKNTTIVYKNAICSSAAILVLVFIVLSVMIPVLLVSLLSPYSGIAESRVLYEQPTVNFKHQYIFLAEVEQKTTSEQISSSATVVCSTFRKLNSQLLASDRHCEVVKYWSEDANYDTRIDHAYFELQLDALPGRLLNFDLMLFFEAELKHKCHLSPPAMLTKRLTVPVSTPALHHGRIVLKAELRLKQYMEFSCPFLGRNLQTKFRAVQIPTNDTDIVDLQQFQMEALLKQLKANSAYFQLDVQETYICAADPKQKLSIELQLHIVQVAARYHLSVWERLGQFWLYFASFFGISFYIMNKLKDFLFGRHIIRAWEVIPWKKLY